MATDSNTHTYNREDIQRVFASWVADFRIVSEWTGLRTGQDVEETAAQVKVIAEQEYLGAVHIQLVSALGKVKKAAVYRVSTSAGAWSADRPGDMYWDHEDGDVLKLYVEYNARWDQLSTTAQTKFEEDHLKGWGHRNFDGYGALNGSIDRRYPSRAYGLERTSYQ